MSWGCSGVGEVNFARHTTLRDGTRGCEGGIMHWEGRHGYGIWGGVGSYRELGVGGCMLSLRQAVVEHPFDEDGVGSSRVAESL